jgi:hypothetical protein
VRGGYSYGSLITGTVLNCELTRARYFRPGTFGSVLSFGLKPKPNGDDSKTVHDCGRRRALSH